MATPYSELFKSFTRKIEDPTFIEMGVTASEEDMIGLLNSAITDFDYPKVDIFDKDDDLQTFNETLSIHEIEILSLLMKSYWTRRQVDSIYNIKQRMNGRDFKQTSQANHLETLMKLEKRTIVECDRKITKYSYKNTDTNKPDYSGLSGSDQT